MHIPDCYIVHFTGYSATAFITLTVFVSACLSGVIKFIEQVKGD